MRRIDLPAFFSPLDAVQASADESRPIPPPNMSASHPSEAYPLHVLIIPSVQRALYIKPLLAASDNGARARTLPSPGPAQSTWLTARLSEACARVNNAAPGGLAQGKEMARTRVKVLLYIAQLWAFRRNGRNLADRAQLSEKMHLNGGQGEQVLEDLISRFSETPRGSNR